MSNKLNILHLSDLHISDKCDSNIRMIEQSLISDIKDITQKKDINIHAILITGDIINKGEGAAFNRAQNILEQLAANTNVPLQNIIMVPGNHDIPRNEFYPEICQKATEQLLSSESCLSLWDTLSPRFYKFSNFSNKYFSSDDKLAMGIGLRELNINDLRIHFYLLNTSWLSHGNSDYQKLAIGKWQYDTILEKKSLYSQPDLVITMSHHPLSWLTRTEHEMAEDFLFNKRKLGTDLLLHGHVHDAKLQVIIRPDHGIAELTSGIGYPDYNNKASGQYKVENCRYSIYEIEPKEKSLTCICRKSANSGIFTPDNSLYEHDNDNGVYTLNWRTPSQSLACQETTATIVPMNNDLSLELDPVPVNSGWCGRIKELEQLDKKEYRVILISGVGGQGKTALASEYLRRMKQTPSSYHAFLWVDFRELQDTMQLKLQQLLEVMSGGLETTIKFKDETLADTVIRFINHIRKKPFLIVFDNVDAYVTLDSEEFIGELHNLVEKVLSIEHKSKILLTCRIPVYDSNANFINIKLDGLKEPEGIEFFKARGIKLDNNDELSCCKKIIKSTKGHPWWLGLIAGQIITEFDSFKKYMADQGNTLVSGKMQLRAFFDSIWSRLEKNEKGKISQNILRHLVEATTPLNQNSISSIIGENYHKTARVLQSLKKLGLLEFHQDIQQDDYLYQVHPLLKEYLHEKYTIENQVPYVKKVLQLFLDSNIIAFLFTPKDPSIGIPTTKRSSKDLLDSVETCLNSRNTEKAFDLLCYFYNRIRDEGLHKEYLTLGCQVLKELNWEKEEVVTIQRKAELLADLIVLLDDMGEDENCNHFLSQYEQLTEPDTIPYSGYLSMKAFLEWRRNNFLLASEYLKEYEEMKKKNSSLWEFIGIQNLKGLVLRDMGQIQDAMAIFDNLEPSATDLGNLARCYQRLKDFDNALIKLRDSLKQLQVRTDLTSRINVGYAYLWMGEVYKAKGDIKKSEECYEKQKTIWLKYAPGLLSRQNSKT